MKRNLEPKKLYFAYGANLNKEAMAYRCPAAIPVGKAVAFGKKRVFRGVADVVKGAAYDKVLGALWEITPECEASLDRFEGYPRLYTKKIVHVWVEQSKTMERAMIYVMTAPKRPLAGPSESYFLTIEQGLKDFEWGRPAHVQLCQQVNSAMAAEERRYMEEERKRR